MLDERPRLPTRREYLVFGLLLIVTIATAYNRFILLPPWPHRLHLLGFALCVPGVLVGIAAYLRRPGYKRPKNPANRMGLAAAFAAIGATIGYAVAIVVVPLSLATVLGRPTVQNVNVQTNVIGGPSDSTPRCRHAVPLEGWSELATPFAKVCLGSTSDRKRVAEIGTVAPVLLHGWGNSLGLWYWDAEVPSAENSAAVH
jgi:hypothetical protein